MRRHPFLVAAAVLLLTTCIAVWLAFRDGVVTLPGGIGVDFSMLLHNLRGAEADPLSDGSLQARIRVPEGFSIETWAVGIPNARLLYTTPAGDLLVTAPRQGQVLLVERDSDGDGRPDGTRELLGNLDRPHGIDWKDGWLYIGEGDAISRVGFDPFTREIHGTPEQIVTGLPNGGNHWSKTVHVGPDDKLYVSVGSSCNVCEEEDPRRAAMLRYELDGSNGEIFASGLRNSVDFDWHPETGELYATDNGRDLLGDNFPPCEINQLRADGFYGWPYVNGSAVPDPDFGSAAPERVEASISPAHELPAHTAPLGISFYDGNSFPSRYRNAAFVALHGSWNRSRKQGYEVVAIHFEEDGSSRQEPFVSGFEIDEDVVGRPVGVAVGPEGELFVSDDYTDSIYRIVYGQKTGSRNSLPTAPTLPPSDPLAGLSAGDRQHAAQRGAVLWEANGCANCHLKDAENTPRKILSGLATRYDLASMQTFLEVPQPPMPRYPFDNAERRDLAVYLFERFGAEN
ncbi:PQQ-dependent sugar dehydrogenase [Myxococcota bacterium]|nr:PQQ-dependent sugar dehydrogenase [Myxococcota bacterium]